MAIINTNLSGTDAVSGDELTSTNLNDTFDALYDLFHVSNW